MTDPEKVNQARLRNVWLGGHIDALQEALVLLDSTSTEPGCGHANGALESARDQINSKLILAQDTLRRLKERS